MSYELVARLHNGILHALMRFIFNNTYFTNPTKDIIDYQYLQKPVVTNIRLTIGKRNKSTCVLAHRKI